jgi:hypothetical protein
MSRIFPALSALLLLACNGDKAPTDSGSPDPEPEELWNAHGWFQRTGEEEGAWIEEEDAVLPASCDGDLQAADGSAGLAYVYVGGSTGGDPFLDEGELVGWPGSTVPSPLYRSSLTGELLAAESHGYPRSFAIESANIGALVYVDVCETALARGECVMPGPSFPFDGCIGTVGQRVSFVISGMELVADAEGYGAETSYGYECDNSNERLDGHPSDVAYGAQTLRLAVTDLPEGERVALDPADVLWSGSVKVEEDCTYIEDLGDVCDCGWSYRERVDIGEAWAQRNGSTLALLIRGQGEDAAFFLWGSYSLR